MRSLTLTLLVACGGAGTPAPETVETARPPLEVTLLTYNVWMLPGVSSDIGARAEVIPELVARQNPDAVVLTEAFQDRARAELTRRFNALGFHATDVLGGGSESHCRSTLGPVEISTSLHLDGGVVLLSRYPLEGQAELLFGDVCAGEDCCSAKGALYARFRKEESCVHVVGTHLQNQTPSLGGGGDPAEVRAAQLEAVRGFAAEQVERSGCPGPVLLAGDLNLLPEDWATLGAEWSHACPITGPESWGGDENRYVETDAPEHLDYVVAVRPGPAPMRAGMQTLIFRGELSVRGAGVLGLRRQRVVTDLSDHHPVLGRFAFAR